MMMAITVRDCLHSGRKTASHNAETAHSCCANRCCAYVPLFFHLIDMQDEIDYNLFSINIDPDALGNLYERIETFLRNPRKLLALQRNLEKVQVQKVQIQKVQVLLLFYK